MSSIVNGVLQDHISVHDRGMLYGQNVFETICVDKQAPLLLDAHISRLQRGCKILNIECDETQIRKDIQQACRLLENSDKAVLRVTLSIGVGGRGYQSPESGQNVRIVSTHPFPNYAQDYWSDGIVLGLSEVELSSQPLLAGIKHGNRLDQVLARDQWLPEWQEAVLLDAQRQVVEATHSNLFVRQGDILLTPELSRAGVAGVMRETIIERAEALGIEVKISPLLLDDIRSADEVFVSNSLIGLWPVKRFQEKQYSNFKISHTLLNTLRDHGAI